MAQKQIFFRAEHILRSPSGSTVAPGSRPEPLQGDEIQLPITPQISRMMRYALFESYTVNPCENLNRCKLIEYFKGEDSRRAPGLRLVLASMNLFVVIIISFKNIK